MSEGPLWYKDSIFYELHVRGFADGNGDGIGDFTGLTAKLPYIRDLGVDCIWLLPFFPSPLRDDGYDIADFKAVHRDYGTLDDFRRFLDEAHSMGLRVLSDLVMNHTSDQHAWFRQARQDRASPYRDWYVWSDTPDRYKDVRIIFKDTETSNWTWDPVAKQYFWHRFFSHQPDLNYDNPAVRDAMLDVVAFWMHLGLDGFRVDAIPYLFEREGTNCENLPETHGFCKELRRFVDAQWPNRLLLAEANQWPQDLVPYFGNGSDEFQMAFHFPLMPRMFMGLRREEKKPIEDILQQLPQLPEQCQWAIFLRNHDELTLEMVSDAERDYMYKEYATDPRMRLNLGIRRRLAPLLDNGRRQMELLYGLLLSLPGSPVIYYGDELGMGDNIYLGDRNGVRTPMQWTMDRNAGFSQADAARLYAPVIVDPVYSYHHLNVEAQNRVPTSLLNWLRRLVRIRARHRLFGRGTLRLLPNSNSRVLTFLREMGQQRMLVVANLSRFAQPCEMQLAELAGWTPREPFGNVTFSKIGTLPYFLTLGPHTFFWFELLPPEGAGSS